MRIDASGRSGLIIPEWSGILLDTQDISVEVHGRRTRLPIAVTLGSQESRALIAPYSCSSVALRLTLAIKFWYCSSSLIAFLPPCFNA